MENRFLKNAEKIITENLAMPSTYVSPFNTLINDFYKQAKIVIFNNDEFEMNKKISDFLLNKRCEPDRINEIHRDICGYLFNYYIYKNLPDDIKISEKDVNKIFQLNLIRDFPKFSETFMFKLSINLTEDFINIKNDYIKINRDGKLLINDLPIIQFLKINSNNNNKIDSSFDIIKYINDKITRATKFMILANDLIIKFGVSGISNEINII